MHAALEAGADGLRESFFGGEALGEGSGGGVRTRCGLRLLDLGEDALQEFLAPAVERILDPLDVAEVGAEADDHRALSISSRIRRTLASRPVKMASPMRKWPMLSSATCGMAATGRTLSNVNPWPACGSIPFFTASAAQSAM